MTLRSFQGYRLLQEYFSFPQRFRFFELTGLARALKRVDGGPGRARDPARPRRADARERRRRARTWRCSARRRSTCSTSAPIGFTSATARTSITSSPIGPGRWISRSTRSPSVVGHGVGTDSEQQFLPFYSAYSTDEEHQQSAYFTTRREPRLVSPAQKRRGSRSSYIGTEVFLSLVDPAQAPFSGDLRQLSIQALCTNRDLVLQMPVGLGDERLLAGRRRAGDRASA